MCLSEPGSSIRRSDLNPDGFTLIELMVVIAIIGLMAAIAIPNYMIFIEKGKAAESAATMLEVQSKLEIYFAKNNMMPNNLAAIGAVAKDEWGNDFVYLPIEGHPENIAFARVEASFPILNTDYDLWSPGKDGLTNKVINAKASQDDIIRAGNGSYFGLAKDYYQ